MVPTIVNVAFGALIALALLGRALDRRSVLLVALAGAVPSLDAIVSLTLYGATNAAFHTLLWPALAFVALYWDTTYRETSWLATRYGWYGVRVAWVTLASVVVAGIGPDLFSVDGVNLLYPLHDRFYSVTGDLLVSTEEGLVVTVVHLGGDPHWLSSPGTTADHHVESWINPTPGTGFETGVERQLTIVDSGWQLIVVAASATAVTVRLGIERWR